MLHVALRAPRGESIVLDGHDVVPDVHAVLDRMAAFADQVRDGHWRGHTGPARAQSSISGSAAPISVRSWPTRR